MAIARRVMAIPRQQVIIGGALAALTLAAWLMTANQVQNLSGPMAVPGDPGMAMAMASSGLGLDAAGMGGWPTFAVFLPMWVTMMVAMMFPAAAPMILLFDRLARQRKARGEAYVPTAIFVAGYLVVWALFGAGAYLVVLAAQTLATQLTDRLPRLPLIALVAILLLAGVYQLSPLKTVCLRHCQTPFAFIAHHWREGAGGAFRMGMHHGTYCLGCCWGLLLVLIAVGLMNLAAMGALTLVIFVEKVSRRGFVVSRVVGVALIGLAIWNAVRPAIGGK